MKVGLELGPWTEPMECFGAWVLMLRSKTEGEYFGPWNKEGR